MTASLAAHRLAQAIRVHEEAYDALPWGWAAPLSLVAFGVLVFAVHEAWLSEASDVSVLLLFVPLSCLTVATMLIAFAMKPEFADWAKGRGLSSDELTFLSTLDLNSDERSWVSDRLKLCGELTVSDLVEISKKVELRSKLEAEAVQRLLVHE